MAKIRNGFVSNSSSSSFVICIKDKEKNVGDILKEAFKVPEGHPLEKLLTDMAYSISYCIDPEDDVIDSVEEYAKSNIQDVEELRQDYPKECELLDKGWRLLFGLFSSESTDPIQLMLHGTPLQFETDEVYFFTDGGY